MEYYQAIKKNKQKKKKKKNTPLTTNDMNESQNNNAKWMKYNIPHPHKRVYIVWLHLIKF